MSMKEWNSIPLKNITTKIGSGATPRGGSESYVDTGISLIRSQNVLDYYFSNDGLAYITDEQAYELKNVIVDIDDVLLNITGDSVARCCSVPLCILPARVNQHVCIIRANKKVLSPSFLKYSLVSQKESLLIISEIGATRRAITKGMIESFEILLPPLPEQEAIAEVLSSLDDKIDLLHRNNKTLEQLAETLFRQWFVEEADDSWEEKSLDEIAEYLNGLALQKYPAVIGEETLPVIKIREMNQGITEATDICSAKIPEQYIVRNGDILFSWSGSLDVILWSGCDGALNQHLFKVSSTDYPKWLIYFGTKLFLPEFRSIAHDKATTMGHIQRKHLTQSVLKLPDTQKIKEYDIRMSGMVDKIISNNSQIKQLEQLRDTLLPKLMSGEVRVQDIKTTIPA